MNASSGSGLCPIRISIAPPHDQNRHSRAHPACSVDRIRPQRVSQGPRRRHRARFAHVEGRRLSPLPEQGSAFPRPRGRLRSPPRPGRAEAVAEPIAGSQGALAKVEAALRAGLETFAGNRELARILLLEAVSLGPAYETKRAEIHERFAALIRGYLDEAAAEGSIPPLDTRGATLAWLGAVNEGGIQGLSRGEPGPLAEAVPALTPMLLRSIGARS